ncbi:hypothetical protein SAMN04488510_10548 [Fervidobacterium changbaicum]|uniref:DNA-binding protein n=2 Tax=Fervidobacterium TaxID=2422 RepID=A0AAI8CMI6_FERIS|nr:MULTISPECIES: hypothetical protein [Fervidobacterium]AMW33100.1 hypothetical protein NA23_07470 [Fervidobacterium islandicum]QAV33142.1 hypothetical protein CBS1_04955 [Fervidobacterium changbaicum]SDH11465.1 hypothetical protein SAMN04488510_10548 [Fervidobacterium changbaicum]
MKKFLVVLAAGVLLAGSIFAFGPMNAQRFGYQAAANTQTSQQVAQAVQQRLHRNLPADASLSATQTFKGTVKEYSLDLNNGFVFKVQVGDTVYDVHAGPIFRLLQLKQGQSIEIVGRIVTTSSDKFIVAEKVTVDGKSFDLASLRGPKGQVNLRRTAQVRNPALAKGYRR